MLRQASRLLLPRGLLSPAGACTSLQSTCWAQFRSKSDDTSVPSEDASFIHNPVDLSATDLVSQADALVAASQAAGDAVVAAAQASTWAGTRGFIDLLMWSHDSMGMPWFEAIAISNLVIKVAVVPLTVIAQRDGPRMMAVRAETEQIQVLAKQLSQARSAGEYERLLEEYKARTADLQAKTKGAWPKMLLMPALGLAQAVLFISQFSAVSTLAAGKLPSMTHEGALWFTDLTLPDPFYGLPIICSAATLAMVSSKSLGDSMAQMGSNAAMMKKMMMFVALAMIPMGAYASSAVALLWASNALISVGQNVILANATVRKGLGLPLPGEVQQPAAAAAGSWMSKIQELTASSSSSEPAAEGVVAPPPGTKAVNYMPYKPRRRLKK